MGQLTLPVVAHAQSTPDAGPALLSPDAGETADAAVTADGGLDEEPPCEPTADAGCPDEEEEVEDGEDVAEESESEAAAATEAPPGVPGLLYSSDISDGDLLRLWSESPEELGSMSVGFADAGRVINGVQMTPSTGLVCVSPGQAWGVQEAVEAVRKAAAAVEEKFPGSPPLRVNHISKKDGGYLRPHQSHQSGRDVDLGFYYREDPPHGWRGRRREHFMDLARNWHLLRTLITESDVQVILVDFRVQRVLYNHALSIGEDKAWLDSIFHGGRTSLIKHARRHRDHFHVRFYAGRSQELGRRIQPLLAKRPDQNILVHRIRRGDTLGHIARRYGTTIGLIRKANRMRGSFLRAGRTILVPLRGPCTRCPLPPPVVVPPRRLPPPTVAIAPEVAPTDEPVATAPSTTNAPGPVDVITAATPPVITTVRVDAQNPGPVDVVTTANVKDAPDLEPTPVNALAPVGEPSVGGDSNRAVAAP